MIGSPLGEMTREEALRADAIRDIGCVACRLRFPNIGTVPCEIHHLTIGGLHGQKRRGHEFSIGLCWWHHRGESDSEGKERMRRWLGPSYAREPGAFREEFGSDDELLEAQNRLIAAYQAIVTIAPPTKGDQ